MLEEIKYPINEIFRSIQCEGFYTGKTAIFVRFSGCNKTCEWCFGVKPGRRNPKIILSNKASKHITDIEIGDTLLTYNDKVKLVETTVKALHTRKVNQWYEFIINDTEYFVTPEHPFFTTRGIVTAENLYVDDYILHSTPNAKCKFRASHHNSMSNPIVAKKKAQNTDYVSVAKKYSETVKKQKKEGTYIPSICRLSKKDKEKFLRRASLSKIGAKNPNWKGGVELNFNRLKKECVLGIKKICNICKKKQKLEVHHLDNDHTNDVSSNMICICHSCHSKIHKRGYNFWMSNRTDGKVLSNIYQANGFKVQSKKYVDVEKHPHYGRSYGPKSLQVFNLSCEPYNSYLLDYMWVHNCDTDHTPKLELTAKEIVRYAEKCKWHEEDLVVFTGGEPTIHNLEPVCKAFVNAHGGVEIAIETNGTNLNMIKDLKKKHLLNWVTISPKDIKDACEEWGLIANEIKIVMDENNLPDRYIPFINRVGCLFDSNYCFIQPCSQDYAPAIKYVLEHPQWRLSVQIQKIIKVF